MMIESKQGYLWNNLIIECQPIVYILFDEFKSNKCDFCMTSNKMLKKCSNCLKIFYCDKSCQKNDWTLHKLECSHYKSGYDILCGHRIQKILFRLYLLLESDPTLWYKTYESFNGHKRCLKDLMTHFDDIREDVERQSELKQMETDFESIGVRISSDVLTKLFGILVINSFGIVIKDPINGYQHCGSGLYVTASALDHSCAPNVYAIANKNRLQLRAKRHIAIDEELVVSYVDTQMSREERQSELRGRYYFDCHCSRCDLTDPKANGVGLLLEGRDDNNNNEFISNFEERVRNLNINYENKIQLYCNPNLTFGLLEDLKRRLSDENSVKDVKQLSEYISYVRNHVIVSHGQHHYLYQLFQSIVQSKGFDVL